MHHCCVHPTLALLLLAASSYQLLGAKGAVSFNYTQDKEVKELALETAGDITALVLKILEKIGTTAPKSHPRDCRDAYVKGHTLSGVYTIQPDYLEPFEVYCDQETDGGGWVVFQRRQDGSVHFERNWNDYVKGFGNINGEFWLGLHKMYRLTRWKRFHPELRIDLKDFQKNAGYAKYSTFHIGSVSTDYTLHVAGYSGTIGDDLSFNNDMKFTTLDRDNDVITENCASVYHGGWWFRNCFNIYLNGVYYHHNPVPTWQGIIANGWKGPTYSLQHTEMKTRPKHQM